MARAVQLPRPLPTREQESAPAQPRVERPVRDSELVPDQVMKALVKELEAPVIERERTPSRDTAPRSFDRPAPERARYHYD